MFGGRPPLDLVTSGSQDGLLTVRRLLDGARGGLYVQPNAIDEAFTPYADTEIVFRSRMRSRPRRGRRKVYNPLF